MWLRWCTCVDFPQGMLHPGQYPLLLLASEEVWPTREALKEGQIEGSVSQPEPSVSQVLSLLGPSIPIREPLAVRLTLESAVFPGTVPVRGDSRLLCALRGKKSLP